MTVLNYTLVRVMIYSKISLKSPFSKLSDVPHSSSCTSSFVLKICCVRTALPCLWYTFSLVLHIAMQGENGVGIATANFKLDVKYDLLQLLNWLQDVLDINHF